MRYGRAVISLTNAAAAEATSDVNRKVAIGLFTGAPWQQLETAEAPVFLDQARLHFQAVLSGPPTAELLRAHISAEQLKLVGGAGVLEKLMRDAVATEGSCRVERIRAAGRTGQLVALKDCAKGGARHRERCTLMRQDPAPPHKTGLFSCDALDSD